jgi:hypothetical protein
MSGAKRTGPVLTVAVVTALTACGSSGSGKRTQDESARAHRRSPATATHRPALMIETLAGARTASVTVRLVAGVVVATDGFLKQHAYSAASGATIPLPAKAMRPRHSPARTNAFAGPVRSGSLLLTRAG